MKPTPSRRTTRHGLLAAITALFAMFVFAGPASAAITFNDDAAPSGTHVQTGTPGCSISGGVVTCTTYELAGVGNANAVATLAAEYSATVTCTNKGGKLVPVKSQTTSATSSGLLTSDKNGRLVVPALSTNDDPPTEADFLAGATCPNGNWTKDVDDSTITLTGFTYTLHFVGFTGNYITITG